MIIPEGFTNCRFIFSLNGVTDPMGFSLAVQAPPGDGPGVIATAVYSQFRNNLLLNAGSAQVGWTFIGVSATKTVAGEPVVGEHIEPVAGSAASAGLVVNTCMLVRKNTASGGRKNRGRMFIPPYNLQESEVTPAGVIGTTFVTGQQSAYDDWHDDLVSLGNPPWLLHSNPADSPTPITSFTVQSLAATQRRRMR